MTLSAELIKIYASGGPRDFVYETLSLAHPLFSATWHITNNPYPLTAIIEDGSTQIIFQPYPFFTSLMGTGESGNQDVEISISNVDKKPIEEIERAAEDPTQQIQMIYRTYAASNLSAPGQVIDGLSVSSIGISENQIVARASASDMLNKVFPGRIYTTTLFPGLNNV